MWVGVGAQVQASEEREGEEVQLLGVEEEMGVVGEKALGKVELGVGGPVWEVEQARALAVGERAVGGRAEGIRA